MKTSAIENKREKWHTNGLTFYYQAGKLCQCRSKRPRLRNGKKKDGTPLQPSPEQIKARKVFKNIIALKHYYFKQIKDLPIWDLAPREAGQTRLSKFHKVNSEACDERGVANYAAFKFSIGQLFRPVNVRATRKGWEITMTWENRENRKLSLPSDWLRVGYFYGSYPFSPRLLPNVVAKREDCQATFSIPNPGLEISEPIHLFLFFSRQDRIAFSTSFHVQL